MKVSLCSRQRILRPCSLEGLTYQLDSYIGCEHHCYYCYALNEAETDWTEEILIHPDIIGQLRHEFSALEPHTIYMGMNTDPYQPSEEIYHQTRQVLELLAEQGFSACVLTKSDLVTRDIDFLRSMPGSSAGISVAFEDDHVRRLFEANAPPNERRIEALKRLKAAGIETYTLICPVMPFITDVESLIEMVAPYVDTIWVYALSMEAEGDQNWQNVRGIVDSHFPGMTERYSEIAFSADHPHWAELRKKLEEFQLERRLNLRIEL